MSFDSPFLVQIILQLCDFAIGDISLKVTRHPKKKSEKMSKNLEIFFEYFLQKKVFGCRRWNGPNQNNSNSICSNVKRCICTYRGDICIFGFGINIGSSGHGFMARKEPHSHPIQITMRTILQTCLWRCPRIIHNPNLDFRGLLGTRQNTGIFQQRISINYGGVLNSYKL